MGYLDNHATCDVCGVRKGILTIWYGRPYRQRAWDVVTGLYVEGDEVKWYWRGHAQCVDRASCEARREKRLQRSRTRGKLLVVAEPQFPNAPRGQCRWCGDTLTGKNAKVRNYCYADREGKDCDMQAARSRAWSARDAVAARGDTACAICGSEDPNWDADHEIALEDGGEHTMENLRRLCSRCHKAKTKRENAERAARRREAQAA
jgi:hypothetical protein